ncbi:OmpH family outer membrane protein [Actibacterium ureilyticum]|uniref:OmpH family outer membrane protein n=1 Tax=Actibacterium ureilyticum TaxID=1590614 RepID=UPI000BAABA0B|nr:OmpH family outer membrane protein [Actibacterium ureilyticum]
MVGRALAAACLAVSCLLPSAGLGQGGEAELRSPILTVDRDRLFTRSARGQAILAALEAESQDLAAENRRIEAQLEEEEQDLTQKRAAMDPAAFRDLAGAFDTKVGEIRDAQSEKLRELTRKREQAQQQFYQDVLPILTDIVRERGAVMVLENRVVFLSAQQVDITADAIARIDARDDTDPPAEPAPEPAPEPDGPQD